MPEHPNFFELLALDPDADWGTIEKRIQEMKDAWSRDSTMGSPKKKQEAKRNLELLPRMLEVLKDPARRRQEAENARRLRAEARKIKEQELAALIGLLQDAGRCSREQFEGLCRQFEGVFSEQEVRAKMEAAGIRIGGGSGAPRQSIDPVTAKDLRLNLDVLKLSSLYELLELPPNTPAADLHAKANALYKESLKTGGTDTAAGAKNKLAGIAITLFRSEEEKRKYDYYRVLDALERIEQQVQLAATGGTIGAQAFETLVRAAAQRGVPEDEIREALEERAATEGWKVERGPASGPAQDSAEPPAPARLIVRPIPDGFRLKWEPVTLPGVRYRVLRKAGSVPWDEGDGQTVAQAGDAQADDTAVPPGTPWHYAVFTLRNGLASTVPAHSGPHVFQGAEGAPAGAAGTSRRLGGLPVRGMAAGFTVLALGTGAALFGPPPVNVLAGLLKDKPAITPPPSPSQPSSPAPPAPGPPPGTPPSAVVQPVSPPQDNAALVPPAAPGNQSGHTFGGTSGGGNPPGFVQGDSATRPAPPPAPVQPQAFATLPSQPQLAVIAVGDPLLAAPLEAELEQALRDEGIDVVSGSVSLDPLRRDRADLPSVREILDSSRGDLHAVVIAQVERTGQRELSFYGRQDVASTARVRIYAYLVDSRKSLSSWSEQIEYTTLNASSEGENAARRAASGLAGDVRNGWSSLRGSN